MADMDERLHQLLASTAYKKAKETAERLKKTAMECNEFRLGMVLEEADAFFSDLKKNQPEVHTALQIFEKEIWQISFSKKMKKEIVIE